jgi:Lipase (class 3)
MTIAGAFAVVCAMGLAVHEAKIAKRIAGVLTFGEPRVGDIGFVRNYNAALGAKTL